MYALYEFSKFLHVMSFVFMSVPLFNLIVVNERVLMGAAFNYSTDRYMENIIKHGAARCFVFQATVFVTGVLLLVSGPLGIKALWTHGVILAKMVLLFVLVGLLSYVHFRLQPRIESLLAVVDPDSPVPEGFTGQLKPYRTRRKRMATVCLLIFLCVIILGMQVYVPFHPLLTGGLFGLAGLFAWRASMTLVRFGWI